MLLAVLLLDGITFRAVFIFINVFLCVNEFFIQSSRKKSESCRKKEKLCFYYYLSLYAFLCSLTVKMVGKMVYDSVASLGYQ